MTIDERLNYLLTLQQSHDDQLGVITDRLGTLTLRMDVLAQRMDVLTERTIQAMDAINRLAHVAANHEDRIEGLEGQSPA